MKFDVNQLEIGIKRVFARSLNAGIIGNKIIKFHMETRKSGD